MEGREREKIMADYGKFERLNIGKKEQIIKSAIKEFNDKGYTSASTNTIIKNANISKGALFTYFGNKEGLFFYLFDNIVDYFMKDMKVALDEAKGDIFDRISLATTEKIKAFIKAPDKFLFMTNAVLNVPDNIKIEVMKKSEELKNIGMAMMFTPESIKGLRRDIASDKIIFIIFSTMESLSMKYINIYKEDYMKLIEDKDVLIREINDYLNILKNTFSQKGE